MQRRLFVLILSLSGFFSVSEVWAVQGIQLTPEYMKAGQLVSTGDYEEAIKELQPLLTSPEFAGQAKMEMGMIRKRQADNEYSQALNHYNDAASFFSDGVMAGGMTGNEAAKTLYELGQIYQERLNDYEKAISVYLSILEDHPDFLSIDKVTYHLAVCYEKTARQEEAAAKYRELVVKFPYSGLFSAAQSRMKVLSPGTGQAVAAIEVQEGIVDDAKTDAQAAKGSMDLAGMYAQEGDYKKAAAEYRKVLDEATEPEMAQEAYQRLAELLDEKERDYKGAAAVLEEFVGQYPDAPKTEENLYKLGQIYEQNLEDKKVRVRDNQLLYKVDTENIERAIEFYDRLTNNSPNADISADAYLRKGDLYENRLKSKDEAKKEYQQFLDHFPNHSKADQIKKRLDNLEY